jgi:hypothetical protein
MNETINEIRIEFKEKNKDYSVICLSPMKEPKTVYMHAGRVIMCKNESICHLPLSHVLIKSKLLKYRFK